MAVAVAVAVRTSLSVLGCVMVAVLVYTIATDGLPFRIELLTRWMAALLIDFYIHIAIIGAWVVYKESSWIMATVWIILLICLGSVTTCGYIVMQFFKLTPEESSKDPFYFVLARHQKTDVTEHRKGPSVVTARVIFAVLGCLMLGTLLYTLIVDGSPFRSELYTPWMVATLIDFYIIVVALAVWVAYKESSWISAFLWILFLVCSGRELFGNEGMAYSVSHTWLFGCGLMAQMMTYSLSQLKHIVSIKPSIITTCVYIVRQLLLLSPDQPVSLILFTNNHRDLKSSNPPLMIVGEDE